MAGRFSVEAVFRAIDGITGPVDRMSRGVSKFTKTVEKNFKSMNDAVKKFGAGLKKYGTIGLGVITGIGYAFYDAMKAQEEFEKAMARAAMQFDGIQKGTAAYEELSQAARQAAIHSKFSAVQTAGGLKALGAAGLDVQRSIAALPAVMNLAQIGEIELDASAKVLTQSLVDFGMASKDATQYQANMIRMSDAMAKTTTTSGASIESESEAMKAGGVLFANAGGGVETFLAVVGKLSQAGVDGGTAGGVLRKAFIKLSAPSKQAAQLMAGLGIKTRDSKNNFRDIVDVLVDVENKTAKMGSAQKLATLSTIFGAKAVSDFSVLLNVGGSELAKYRDKIKAAAGTSNELGGELSGTLAGKFAQFTNTVTDLKISIASLRSEAVKKLVDDFTKMAAKLSEIIGSNSALSESMITDLGQAILSVTKIFGELVAIYAVMIGYKVARQIGTACNWAYAASFWAIRMAVYSYWALTKLLLPLQVSLNVAIAFLPAIILVAIAAWGTAIYEMVSRWDEFSTSIEEFWKLFKQWGSSAIDWVIDALKFVAEPFVSLYNAVSDLLGKGKEIKDLFDKPVKIAVPVALPGLGGRAEPESATPGWITGETAAPQVVSPAARMADTISEKRTMNSFELKIKDESPKKERSTLTGNGRPIRRASSGAFAPVHG